MHFNRHGVIASLGKVIRNHDKQNTVAQPKFERRKDQTPQEEGEDSVRAHFSYHFNLLHE